MVGVYAVMVLLLGACVAGAKRAPEPLPVGETGGANGGAASRGTGCRALSPAILPVLPSPKLGGSRSEVRGGGAPAWSFSVKRRGKSRRAEGAEILPIVIFTVEFDAPEEVDPSLVLFSCRPPAHGIEPDWTLANSLWSVGR